MNYSSDLNLGEGLCIFTSFHFQDSGLYLLYVTVLTFNSICFGWSDTENPAICIFCLYLIIPSVVNQVPFSGLCLLLFRSHSVWSIPVVIRIGLLKYFYISSASSLRAEVVCILFNNNRETIF